MRLGRPSSEIDGVALEVLSSTISSVASCVAARMTRGACPASNASRQRAAHRHQRSPGLSPGKSKSGCGVERSLPLALEKARNSAVTSTHTVCRPDILGAGMAAAGAKKPVSGRSEQLLSGSP